MAKTTKVTKPIKEKKLVKAKKKLNTDLDEAVSKKRTKSGSSDLDKDFDIIEPIILVEEDAISHNENEGDEITYTMGAIQVGDSDDSEEEDADEFKNASKILNDADEDEEWVEDEVNTDDIDPFLDEADFDGDNPDYDKSYDNY